MVFHTIYLHWEDQQHTPMLNAMQFVCIVCMHSNTNSHTLIDCMSQLKFSFGERVCVRRNLNRFIPIQRCWRKIRVSVYSLAAPSTQTISYLSMYWVRLLGTDKQNIERETKRKRTTGIRKREKMLSSFHRMHRRLTWHDISRSNAVQLCSECQHVSS